VGSWTDPATRASNVRARRSAKPDHDPRSAQGWQREQERQPDGELVDDLTVFLTGGECPWACVFCDLWRYTIDAPTPTGAIPQQLKKVIEACGPLPSSAQLKLYNASNYFDAKAVPEADDAAVANLARPLDRVIVESHPKLIGARTFRFAERLDGTLQVAMGLETVHPKAQPKLGKGADLDAYASAAQALASHGITWRAFVLVGAPWVPTEEDSQWVQRTARFAIDHGADHITLIPVRGGNGTLEQLQQTGHWTPPTLRQLEAAYDTCFGQSVGQGLGQGQRAVVSADLWDLKALPGGCPTCRGPRTERLAMLNRTGRMLAPIACRCEV
jgi:radical SAM enzyme (TIGR01210 family)